MNMYPTGRDVLYFFGFVSFFCICILLGRVLPPKALKLAALLWFLFCLGWYIYYFPNYQN